MRVFILVLWGTVSTEAAFLSTFIRISSNMHGSAITEKYRKVNKILELCKVDLTYYSYLINIHKFA